MDNTSESGVLDSNGLIRSSPSSIYLFSGGSINPLDPDPADIKVEDIAHALSNQCRWTGHTTKFYSVAEHCVQVSMLLGRREHTKLVQKTGLLHDATEAYLADLARPIKKAAGLGEVYLEVEAQLEVAVGKALGIPGDPFSVPVVKWADEQLLYAEGKLLVPAIGEHLPFPEDDLTLYCWNPAEAEAAFLAQWEVVSG